MLSQYVEELEQDPFEVEEFIERLCWRTNNEIGSDQFDPDLLYETFVETIKDMKILQERQQRKCDKLEEALKEEQAIFVKAIDKFVAKHQVSVDYFHQLDEKINSVAGKVIHLGEQLENVNNPRSRAVEAQLLLNHMTEFLTPGPIVNDIYSDKTKLYEAADIIQKLFQISQDLPAQRFANAKKKIESKYDDIEMQLIEEFATAQKTENIERMKELSDILSQFKGYTQVIDVYIEQSQATTYGGRDVFEGIVPMCHKHYKIIQQVFSAPDKVISKFILNIYQLKINQFVQTKLDDRKDEHKYLKTLSELYSRTLKLSAELQDFFKGSDDDLLQKLTANIFDRHLATYIEVENRTLDGKCQVELKKFYENKNHQKKQIERFQELRRDMQALIGARANINIAQIEDYGGETFLSEELAINLLQQSSHAFERCCLLSKENDLPRNILKLTDILLRYLLHEHCDYALDLGLQAIPIAECKSVPQIYFFDVAQKCNAIVHLLEKTYNASVMPNVIGTPQYTDCIQKKRSYLETVENKIETGLERTLNAIFGWVKTYLASEQKKSDFKPDTDVDTVASNACLAVVQYLNPLIGLIQKTIDGENLAAVLTEFGVRYHRVIFEHLQQFQYNTAGAMCAICDVNEYRKSARVLQSPLVTQLFDVLHALCNLLLVKHENLQEVCGGETLNYLDKSVVMNFIQLRSDYKTIKISNSLKGISDQRIV
ncbi:exocyst complex component 5 [Anopheles ziemanni]|uniref:exocyst complex component 5 n=1 Tax=Anopheles coustani TaxID=139045 RepID=UPI0026584871|nr:exocyst complex component 5 [Anopheles coustani]XP_058119340.1 exocyst complex component 5 [Anopheles coustani]XP_058175077.1 exocyst complex component 5 [Anopheles ziemanni]